MAGRARKVITRSGRKFRGKFPSRKLGRMVHFESLLERDAIAILEAAADIASYQEQPRRVEYSDGEVIREYFPDFQAVAVTGEVVDVEVKSSAQFHRNAIKKKFSAIWAHYWARGELLAVVTEHDLRGERRIAAFCELRDRGSAAPGWISGAKVEAQGGQHVR